ncbi:hypothetical protein [Erythrobacter ani]|uniref:CENP-V/GFA domain-containing protein n=1 Tax=Erythrobacter ani TaxID=2827235 RepID=A0ABS6SQA4_9SPHN|nr:hypothetical protein [Erythrobacter ani]MBV7267180.1 hypothetical protein [Erythrobacter ani]
MRFKHSGACHCGAIGVALSTDLAAHEIAPRACGCDFCLKHRPNWFSDRSGHLTIIHSITPNRYRFGTQTADFLICPNCGVVVAAVCESDGEALGVFNLNCLEANHDWSQRAVSVDFDGEDTGDRLARRAANWMPVALKDAD